MGDHKLRERENRPPCTINEERATDEQEEEKEWVSAADPKEEGTSKREEESTIGWEEEWGAPRWKETGTYTVVA
jgi:hypothetical protein